MPSHFYSHLAQNFFFDFFLDAHSPGPARYTIVYSLYTFLYRLYTV